MSVFSNPIDLINVGSAPAGSPASGFNRLFFQTDWLKKQSVSAAAIDVVLDRPLDNFTCASVATPLAPTDTVLEAFQKICGTFATITLIGDVTGTASYNGGQLQIDCTSTTTISDLQGVTDVGNTTTNDIIITSGSGSGLQSDLVHITGGTGTQGQMTWNNQESTVELVNNGTTTLIGQDFHYHVRNNSGATINKGTVVMATGSLGSSGKITIGKYIADGSIDSHYMLGVLQETLINNAEGKVHGKGKIDNIDTSGTLSFAGETWLDGDVLYISDTVLGALTKVKPTAPSQKIPVAFVVYAHATQGILQVRALPQEKLEDNEQVQITSIANNDILAWNSTNSRFENIPGSALSSSFTISDSSTSQVVSNGDTILFTDTSSINLAISGYNVTATVLPAGVDHDSLQNFVANEHIDHTTVTLTAGEGISGGGDISASRTFDLDLTELSITSLTTNDYIAFDTSAGANGKALVSGINLSIFNDDILSGNYLPLTGGTVTGPIIYASGPSLGSELVNKDYVDSLVQGIDWKESVLQEVDFTTSEPGGPTPGDRYINTATGSGSNTAQSVTQNYIYEWNGTDWTEISVNEGATTRNEFTDTIRHFDGTNWIDLGSTTTHNTLGGLQGGTSGEYYHLTAAEHTIATQAATSSLSGYLTSADWTTFNSKAGKASGLLNTWTSAGGGLYYQDFTHNLGTEDIVTEVYDSTTKETVLVESIDRQNTNTVRVTVVGNSTTYRITVIG